MSSFESEEPWHAGARLGVWNEGALVIEADASRLERGGGGHRRELHTNRGSGSTTCLCAGVAVLITVT